MEDSMKEKVLIIGLCCIVIFLNIRNAACGPAGKNATDGLLQEQMVLQEESFVVAEDTESGEYVFQAGTAEDENNNLKLYAISACMIDAESGRILYGRNPYEVRAMASTTKIMTCLLALENCSIDEVVTVSEYAASMPDVQLNMRAGEQFRLYDLLLSMMLESHNDTAVAIAEHVGGSVEKFCSMMTERAGELGCINSVFLTPNGLDKEIVTENGTQKHATTAEELALILRECLKNEQFVAICRTQNAMIYNTDKTKSYQLSNHNALLNMMDGVIVGKTGFTCDAGYCYVGAVERNGITYICALLGCGWPNNKNYKWQDMKVLIDYAEKHYKSAELSDSLISEAYLKDIPVQNAVAEGKCLDTISLKRMDNSGIEALTVRTGEQLTLLYELPSVLNAPLVEGEEVGRIHYMINGQTLMTESLTVEKTIDKIEFEDYFNLVKKAYLLSD